MSATVCLTHADELEEIFFVPVGETLGEEVLFEGLVGLGVFFEVKLVKAFGVEELVIMTAISDQTPAFQFGALFLLTRIHFKVNLPWRLGHNRISLPRANINEVEPRLIQFARVLLPFKRVETLVAFRVVTRQRNSIQIELFFKAFQRLVNQCCFLIRVGYYLVDIGFSDYLLIGSRNYFLCPVLDHRHHFVATDFFVGHTFVVVLLHDQVVNFQLAGGSLYNFLFHGALSHEPVYINLLFLADPMRSVDCLQVHLWIPI